MKKEKSALLVIDMQLVAFDGKITPPINNGQQLLRGISTLVQACRSSNKSTIFMQTCAMSGRPYAQDTHGWEIHPELGPADTDIVVHKVHSNGFEDTNLHATLVKENVETIITCGIWSEYCLTATSKAALDMGYRVCVVKDGHGTVADNNVLANAIVEKQNKELARLGAQSMDVATITHQLQASSDNQPDQINSLPIA